MREKVCCLVMQEELRYFKLAEKHLAEGLGCICLAV